MGTVPNKEREYYISAKRFSSEKRSFLEWRFGANVTLRAVLSGQVFLRLHFQQTALGTFKFKV